MATLIGCFATLWIAPILLGVAAAGVTYVWFQNNRHTVTEISPPVQTSTVSMLGNRFQPNHVQVQAGQTVVWSNDDTWLHNVVFRRSVLPASPYLPEGERFTTTFRTAGTFDYACSLHTGMIGRVTVVKVTD